MNAELLKGVNHMKKIVSLVLALTLCLSLMGTSLAEDKIFAGHSLVYTSWGDSATQTAKQAIIDKFMEDTGCEVNYICINENYDTKITAMIAAGETIDLAEMESGTIGFKLAEEGHYELLDPYIERDGIDMDDYVAASCYYDDNGNLISYSGCIELMTMFYSKDVFDEAGLPYPPSDPDQAWTWDEFVDVAMKLTLDANGKTPYDEGFDPENIVRYGVNMGIWWPIWGSFILSNGGTLVDAEGNFAMNQPASVEALQAIADLALVKHCMPTPTAREGMPGTDVALLTGAYAMVVDGQWLALTLADTGVNFGAGTLPRMGGEVVSVCTNGMSVIMKDSKEKEAAWALQQYLQDPGKEITLFKNGNLMPSGLKWLTEKEYLDQWAEEGNPARPEGYDGVIKMLLNNSAAPFTGTIKNFSDMIDIVNKEVDEIVYGNKTAQEGMDSAAEQIKTAGIELALRTAK